MSDFRNHNAMWAVAGAMVVRSTADKVVAEILSFRDLPNGWHFGSGVPSTEAAFNAALEIHRFLSEAGASQIEAFPMVDGGVVVSGLKGEYIVDVSCRHDGGFGLYIEKSGEQLLDETDVSLSTLRAQVRFLGWRANSLSGCFIQNITRGLPVVSTQQQFNHRTMACQSSTKDALNGARERFAVTFRTIMTQKSPENLQFFSGSESQISLRTH